MPVGDTHITGYDDIPLTHELGAKQWLQETLNNPDNEDQREATIAFMEKLGWIRVGDEHLSDG
jgi:hypothetical protein